MKTSFLERKSDVSLLIMRTALGAVVFAHGAQKLFGWFDGFGFAATMEYFTHNLELPWVLGFLVIMGESFGAIALLLGFLGRFMSIAMLMIFAGAFYFDHAQNGFFMNWFGNRAGGEGFEFDLLVFGLAIPLAISGSGFYSLDRLVLRATEKRT